jgi:heme-degrading monooxygenase HmoA
MSYMMIRHKVRDFDEWKPGYDAHRPAREAAGLREVQLLRNIDDPQEVVVLFEVSDLEKARAFAASEDLKQKMQEVGVTDRPDIYYLQ